MRRRKILIVDDDPNILSSFQRQLHRLVDVVVAGNGNEGLAKLADEGPFDLVISDFRMPGMDGVAFLASALEKSPDTARILLTGYADVETATRAVNEGNIFRLLTKPCSGAVLAKAIMDALNFRDAVTAEKEILDRTLRESMRVVTELMTLHSPETYGRTARLMPWVRDMARAVGGDPWEVETAASLSVLGYVILPENLMEKVLLGQALKPDEERAFAAHAAFAGRLLETIPRMAGVAAAVSMQEKRYDGSGYPAGALAGDDIPVGARILKVVNDFDTLLESGMPKAEALLVMRGRNGWYDPQLLDALTRRLGDEARFVLRKVNLPGLQPGMILARDITFRNGEKKVKVLGRGYEITDATVEYLMRFTANNDLEQPFHVLTPLELETGKGAA